MGTHSVAFATEAQVANALFGADTFRAVENAPDQDWRRDRLQALIDHADYGGSKVALGKALGYADGAYVGQMLKGHRPITEKLVQEIHTMHGGKYRAWFAKTPEAAPAQHWPFEMIPLHKVENLSEQQKGMLQYAMLDAMAKMETIAAPAVASRKQPARGR